MTRYKIGPDPLRSNAVTLSVNDTARLLALIKAEGSIERLRLRMGIGDLTMDSARAFGRMRAATRARVIDAIGREEARDA